MTEFDQNGFWFCGGYIGKRPPHSAPAGQEWRYHDSKTDRELRINGGPRRWFLVDENDPAT